MGGSTFSLGSASLSGGVATYVVPSGFGVGATSLSATYSGDSNDDISTSGTITQTVIQGTATTTTLTSSANPSAYGQTVTLSATVSPAAATGTITFYADSSALATVTLSGGTATLPVSTLARGTHSLYATYSADSTYSASQSASITQIVNPLDGAVTTTIVTSSANPSILAQSVTLTATVSPSTATGTVTFYELISMVPGATPFLNTLGAGFSPQDRPY